MRLLNLKLLTKFRGLPAGSEFSFDNAELKEGKLEPICLVGLNGSGKSNLLEVICEIFYFLDDYVLSEGKPPKKFRTPFGFEISYVLDPTFKLAREERLTKIDMLSWRGIRDTHVTITKEKDKLPAVTLVTSGHVQITNSNDYEAFILPNHVIAYSSGQNELISNPFIKSSYSYFELLGKKAAKEINLELGLNRLFYLDYESSQIASICNYLFAEHNNVKLITKELKLNIENPVDSFSITIQYKIAKNRRVSLPLSIENAVEGLKACATVVEEVKKHNEIVELRLAFWFSQELRNAFQRKFGSALSLFKDLYYLNLMNIHLHGLETRNRIKNAPSMTYDNLSHLLPVPRRDKLIFTLDKFDLIKRENQKDLSIKILVMESTN